MCRALRACWGCIGQGTKARGSALTVYSPMGKIDMKQIIMRNWNTCFQGNKEDARDRRDSQLDVGWSAFKPSPRVRKINHGVVRRR